MTEPTIAEMRTRLEEAEALIRKLLLCTTYDSFQSLRRPAEKMTFSLREMLDAQNKRVCDKLDHMRGSR